MNPFVEQHQSEINNVLSCFDRVVMTGMLPDIGHAQAMTGLLGYNKIRVFDYTQWAEPLRNELRSNAELIAGEAGLEIEFIRNHTAFRKEDRIKEILATRGEYPGLVHIFSAMESCASYRPWFDKKKQYALLKPTTGKCLHYYYYFIDEEFGLCYVRVPTWAPFRLQVYFNGHSWLARQLLQADIPFEMADNAFLPIADPDVPSTSPTALMRAASISTSTLGRYAFVRWSNAFAPVTTGASCKLNLPPMWFSAANRHSSPFTRPSCAPPCM